jgi:hypothetical protein
MLRLCFASGDAVATANGGLPELTPLALIFELTLDDDTYRFAPRNPVALEEETDRRDLRFPRAFEYDLTERASSELDISPGGGTKATCP